MNIKTQHYLGACVSTAIVLVIGMILLVASQRVGRATDRSEYMTHIIFGISELRAVTFEYIVHRHERPRVQWLQRHDSVAKLLASDTFAGTGQQQIVDVLRQRHQDLKGTFSRLTQTYASAGNGSSDPAETALSRELEARLVGQLAKTSQEIASTAARLAWLSESEAANTQRWAGVLVMLAIALMALIVFVNTALGVRYILKPIGRLQRGMEIIGNGDLSYRTGITSSNEIGALSQAFDRMTARVLESRTALEAERLRAAKHAAIEESEVRYRGIVESVMQGIVTVDERQRIVLFNPGAERIFGRSAAAMIGEPLGILIPERYRARHDEHIRRFAATGETNRAMGRYGLIYGLHADGTEFPIEATISRSGTSPDELLTVVLHDITERIRAEEALRANEERLRQLSRRLFEAEEEQRRLMARELHDRVGQNVTALTLNLNMVRGELPAESLYKVSARLLDCEKLLDHTAELIRDVMADLRPPGLDELGLAAALHEHAREVSGRSGFRATVRGEPLRLPSAVEITLFRIAQEALTNVGKHARATEVSLALKSGPDTVTLTIADNGRGFDPAARPERPSASLGLVGMLERAQAIGARLRVESAPGEGARVIVEAPRAVPGTGSG